MVKRVAALLALIWLASCGGPRDPARTLQSVDHGVIRVGVIDNPPFALNVEGQVEGVEPAMVRELASQLHSKIVWVPGPAPDLLESLERFQLDLVIGGLTSKNPWRQKLAITDPFYVERLVVGSPPDVAAPRELDGVRVSVRVGDVAAALLRDRGAVPVFVPSLRDAKGNVAVPEWKLSAIGRSNSGIILAERNHVWALPRGENGWLVRVEQFLRSRKSQVPAMLHEEQAREGP